MANTPFDPGLTQTFSGRIRRTINKDGTFNVRRLGIRLRDAGYFLYFMEMSWPSFLVRVPLIYLGIELLFAAAYYAIGVEHLAGATHSNSLNDFLTCFFFSIQTFTTVGYGHLAPSSVAISTVAAVEAMSGILSLAIATGLIYARFSRPSARLLFSSHAIVAPFEGGRALMFRVANRRPNILMELEATLLMMEVEQKDGETRRTFRNLALEREKVYFLPLSWTIVHPINESSPLWNKTAAQLESLQAELLILIKGFDDTFSQTVHSRHSYTHDEIRWDRKFEPAFHISPEGDMLLDLQRLDKHKGI